MERRCASAPALRSRPPGRRWCAHHPALTDVWLRFASPPIRNAGTMGGNVANGSPIGDSAPVLIALGASLVLRRGRTRRTLPLQDFYLDYMKNALEPGEFVEAIEVPLQPADALPAAVRAYKISKRFDSDISAVCLGAWIQLDGGIVREVRLAFGGMAAIVKRADAAEAALRGQPWDQAHVDAAQRRAGRRLQAADRHAGERRRTGCRWREPAAAAVARDARRRAARRGPDERVQRAAACGAAGMTREERPR